MMHLINYLSGLKSKQGMQSLDVIRPYMFKQYIKMAVEPVTDSGKCRVSFTANKSKSDFANPMVAECNGAVMEWDSATSTFTPLAIPQLMASGQRLSRSVISKYCEEDAYTLHGVYDGTMVNLYYYQGKWRVSTTSAYDATDLVFVDSKTYRDMVEEVWQGAKVLASKDHWDCLSKDHCYSMCITYPGFHLAQSKYSCVLTQCVDMRTMAVLSCEEYAALCNAQEIAIPMDEPISLPPRGRATKPRGKKGTDAGVYAQVLRMTTCKGSMGVILRAKPSAARASSQMSAEYRTVFIPSEAYKRIKRCLYNLDFMKNLSYTDTLADMHASPDAATPARGMYNIQAINAMHKFLQVHQAQHYLAVAPWRKDLFSKYSEFMQFLTNCICKNVGYLSSLQQASGGQRGEGSLPDSVSVWTKSPLLEGEEFLFPQAQHKLDKLVLKIWVYMREKKIMPVNGLEPKENRAIIADMLRNVHWLDDYYSLIYC